MRTSFSYVQRSSNHTTTHVCPQVDLYLTFLQYSLLICCCHVWTISQFQAKIMNCSFHCILPYRTQRVFGEFNLMLSCRLETGRQQCIYF